MRCAATPCFPIIQDGCSLHARRARENKWTEVRTGENGAAEVRAVRLGYSGHSRSRQVCPAQIGVMDVGAGEIGAREIGPAQCAHGEVRVHQVGARQIDATEVRPAQGDSTEIGASHILARQSEQSEAGFCTTEVGAYERGYVAGRSERVPDHSKWLELGGRAKWIGARARSAKHEHELRTADAGAARERIDSVERAVAA